MNYSDLVARAAEGAGVSKTDAARVVQGTLDAIATALQAGDEVPLKGLGKFKVRSRAARAVRNPRTGATVQAPADRKVVFQASATLKNICGGDQGALSIDSGAPKPT